MLARNQQARERAEAAFDAKSGREREKAGAGS